MQVVTFYHDIKADLYPQWMKKERNIISEIEFRIGIKQEALNQKVADVNVVFNTRDAEVFQKHYGKRPEAIIPLPAPVPSIPNDIMNLSLRKMIRNTFCLSERNIIRIWLDLSGLSTMSFRALLIIFRWMLWAEVWRNLETSIQIHVLM